MKVSEVIKILPEDDKIFVTTEENKFLYEGKVCDLGKETLKTFQDAEVIGLSPDWQEEIIIVILPD